MHERTKAILRGAALYGSLIALVIAAAVTLYDWWLNPGDVFHDASGTSWPAVRETFFSWFLPLLPACWAIAAFAHILVQRLSRSD